MPDGGKFINLHRLTGDRLDEKAKGEFVVAEYFRDGEEPTFGDAVNGGFAMGSNIDLFSEESWSGNIGKLRLRGPFALDVAVEPTDILWESFLMNEILDCDGNCAQQIDECGVCGGEGLAEGACDCVMAMLSTIVVSVEVTDPRVPDWVSRLTIAAASPVVLWMLGPMF